MELKPGYKQTEVGVIPEDWDVLALAEIGNVIRGASPRPKGDKRFYGGNIPRLMVEDVTRDGKYVFPRIDYLTVEGAKRSRFCKQGTLTIVCSGTVGITAFLGIDACIHDGFLALININKGVFDDYLYHQLCSLQVIFNRSATHGGVFTNLTTAGVKQFNFPLPSTKAEQTAIANALSDADALIQSLTRLIAKKRQIKQGAMQTLLNPYKNGRLKAGWVVKKLGDVANICRGASPRPIDSPKWFDENSDIGWVRISDITRAKKYLKTTVQKLTAEGVKHSRYVPSSNLIMSICATVGRPILNQIDVCIHDGFVVFGNCTVDKQYLYYFLDSVEQDWSKHGQTGSQMNLNTRLINDTVFPMPKVFSEQTRIATILSDMDAEITALETKLAKYRHIKQGMMQNLLTGRIRLVKPESKTGAVA